MTRKLVAGPHVRLSRPVYAGRRRGTGRHEIFVMIGERPNPAIPAKAEIQDYPPSFEIAAALWDCFWVTCMNSGSRPE